MNPFQYITNVKEEYYTEAQQALQKALIGLNQNMEIHSISVKALCSQAHVARSTFYSYYGNVMQLKEEIEDRLLLGLLKINDNLSTAPIDEVSEFPFFQDTCHFIEENRQAFQSFLIANPNVAFIQKWQTGIKFHFWNRFFDGKKIKNADMILEILSIQTITAFTYWMKNPSDIDMKSLNRLIMRSLKLFE